MNHPDYELMIARQEIDCRLRESLLEHEVRKALACSPSMWEWISQRMRLMAGNVYSAGQRARHEGDCSSGRSTHA